LGVLGPSSERGTIQKGLIVKTKPSFRPCGGTEAKPRPRRGRKSRGRGREEGANSSTFPDFCCFLDGKKAFPHDEGRKERRGRPQVINNKKPRRKVQSNQGTRWGKISKPKKSSLGQAFPRQLLGKEGKDQRGWLTATPAKRAEKRERGRQTAE